MGRSVGCSVGRSGGRSSTTTTTPASDRSESGAFNTARGYCCDVIQRPACARIRNLRDGRMGILRLARVRHTVGRMHKLTHTRTVCAHIESIEVVVGSLGAGLA